MKLPKDRVGLGFKDLEQSNMALLVKQCWRLLDNLNSLWAIILKARYFPVGNFLEAQKGHRPSWSWSNLIEAKDHLIRGYEWEGYKGVRG